MAVNHIDLRLDESGVFLFLAQVGNSGSSSEPHLHIHHQRQDPSKVSMFFAEGLPLYFRTEKGAIMPERGTYISGK